MASKKKRDADEGPLTRGVSDGRPHQRRADPFIREKDHPPELRTPTNVPVRAARPLPSQRRRMSGGGLGPGLGGPVHAIDAFNRPYFET